MGVYKFSYSDNNCLYELERWCSLVNTPPCHGGDHGFESRTLRIYKKILVRSILFCNIVSLLRIRTGKGSGKRKFSRVGNYSKPRGCEKRTE